MDFVANFSLLGSRRSLFGQPAADLDWSAALSLVSDLASLPGGQAIVSFLSASNARRLLANGGHRDTSRRQPGSSDGTEIGTAALPSHGMRFPTTLNSTDFVPALLTYMDSPKRIGLVGTGNGNGTVGRAVTTLRKHSPWHEFVVVPENHFSRAGDGRGQGQAAGLNLDILLVGMDIPEQEKWVDHHVGPGDARLVMTAGPLFKTLCRDTSDAPELLRRLRLEWLYRLCL